MLSIKASFPFIIILLVNFKLVTGLGQIYYHNFSQFSPVSSFDPHFPTSYLAPTIYFNDQHSCKYTITGIFRQAVIIPSILLLYSQFAMKSPDLEFSSSISLAVGTKISSIEFQIFLKEILSKEQEYQEKTCNIHDKTKKAMRKLVSYELFQLDSLNIKHYFIFPFCENNLKPPTNNLNTDSNKHIIQYKRFSLNFNSSFLNTKLSKNVLNEVLCDEESQNNFFVEIEENFKVDIFARYFINQCSISKNNTLLSPLYAKNFQSITENILANHEMQNLKINRTKQKTVIIVQFMTFHGNNKISVQLRASGCKWNALFNILCIKNNSISLIISLKSQTKILVLPDLSTEIFLKRIRIILNQNVIILLGSLNRLGGIKYLTIKNCVKHVLGIFGMNFNLKIKFEANENLQIILKEEIKMYIVAKNMKKAAKQSNKGLILIEEFILSFFSTRTLLIQENKLFIFLTLTQKTSQYNFNIKSIEFNEYRAKYFALIIWNKKKVQTKWTNKTFLGFNQNCRLDITKTRLPTWPYNQIINNELYNYIFFLFGTKKFKYPHSAYMVFREKYLLQNAIIIHTDLTKTSIKVFYQSLNLSSIMDYFYRSNKQLGFGKSILKNHNNDLQTKKPGLPNDLSNKKCLMRQNYSNTNASKLNLLFEDQSKISTNVDKLNLVFVGNNQIFSNKLLSANLRISADLAINILKILFAVVHNSNTTDNQMDLIAACGTFNNLISQSNKKKPTQDTLYIKVINFLFCKHDVSWNLFTQAIHRALSYRKINMLNLKLKEYNQSIFGNHFLKTIFFQSNAEKDKKLFNIIITLKLISTSNFACAQYNNYLSLTASSNGFNYSVITFANLCHQADTNKSNKLLIICRIIKLQTNGTQIELNNAIHFLQWDKKVCNFVFLLEARDTLVLQLIFIIVF